MKLLDLKIKYHFYLKRIMSLLGKTDRAAASNKTNKILDNFSFSKKGSRVLLHVGLSEVKSESADHAYEKIINALEEVCNYAIPAFTPCFRKSGVFSYENSKPEVGRFSLIAMNKSLYRTHDPIHSLFMSNKINENEFNISDTFAEDGLYSVFCESNSFWVNVGTEHLVSTVFHYIERVANVPYLEQVKHKGVMYKNDEVHEIEHISYKYNRRVVWNRKKIEKSLSKAGAILQQGYWNGAYCQVIDGHLAAKVLLNKLKDDPYYLVT